MSTLQTDLNVAPFYDDFNANNQYYRILFRPSTAVQARELTQIQTILQNQISTFGSSIYKDGSIIEGCTFTRYPYMAQVRFKDSNTTTLDFNTITQNTYLSLTFWIKYLDIANSDYYKKFVLFY